MTYYLSARYDDRQSFYCKAEVEERGNTKTLLSYKTKVCRIKDGKVTFLPDWNYSNTTVRHVREFLRQEGFAVGSKDEMAKMYPVKAR